MGIKQICESIKNLFTGARPPFPILPGVLIVCSMIKRPGLSTIHSTSNVVADLSKLGIPTGLMPDGSANLTVGFTYAMIKEIFRALKKDASIQGALQPGASNVVTQGAGGTAAGTIVNAPSVKVDLN